MPIILIFTYSTLRRVCLEQGMKQLFINRRLIVLSFVDEAVVLTRQGELRVMPLHLPELVAMTLLEHRSVAAALVRMALGRTVLPEMLPLETGRMQTEMPRTRTQVRKSCLQRPQTRASTVLKHAVRYGRTGIRTHIKSTSVRYPRRFLCHHCLFHFV